MFTAIEKRLRSTAIAVAALSVAAGCSVVLDFDKAIDAAPADAPVTAEQCAANEPNETPTNATAWMGADVTGAICGNGDLDHFAVSLGNGQPIHATLTFMNRNGLGDLDLRLLSGDGGTVLDNSRTSGDVEMVECAGPPCPPITAGTYVVEIRGFTPTVQSAYLLHIDTMATAIDAGVD
jgi:hypothetical protein